MHTYTLEAVLAGFREKGAFRAVFVDAATGTARHGGARQGRGQGMQDSSGTTGLCRLG